MADNKIATWGYIYDNFGEHIENKNGQRNKCPSKIEIEDYTFGVYNSTGSEFAPLSHYENNQLVLESDLNWFKPWDQPYIEVRYRKTNVIDKYSSIIYIIPADDVTSYNLGIYSQESNRYIRKIEVTAYYCKFSSNIDSFSINRFSTEPITVSYDHYLTDSVHLTFTPGLSGLAAVIDVYILENSDNSWVSNPYLNYELLCVYQRVSDNNWDYVKAHVVKVYKNTMRKPSSTIKLTPDSSGGDFDLDGSYLRLLGFGVYSDEEFNKTDEFIIETSSDGNIVTTTSFSDSHNVCYGDEDVFIDPPGLKGVDILNFWIEGYGLWNFWDPLGSYRIMEGLLYCVKIEGRRNIYGEKLDYTSDHDIKIYVDDRLQSSFTVKGSGSDRFFSECFWTVRTGSTSEESHYIIIDGVKSDSSYHKRCWDMTYL